MINLQLFAPIAIQVLTAFVKYCVDKAENKFKEAKTGETKKDYVLKKIDHYLDINPEIKDQLPEEISNDLGLIVDKIVSKTINK